MTLTLLPADLAPEWLAAEAPLSEADTLEDVELLNGGVWLAGKLNRGHFRRLSDYVNHSSGRILLRDAAILGPGRGDRREATRDAWVDPVDLDVIGQRADQLASPPDGMAVEKRRHLVTALTSSHEIRGTVHVYRDADLAGFIAAGDPPLMVMTDAVVSWLADGCVVGQFALALVNRRRTFAVLAG